MGMVTPTITEYTEAEADARFVPLTGARLQRHEAEARRACGVPLSCRTVSGIRAYFALRVLAHRPWLAADATAPALKSCEATAFDSNAPPVATGATLSRFAAQA